MMRGKINELQILGIAPSTRGVGFAVLEGEKLLDWGVKGVTGDKSTQSLMKVKTLIRHYQPTIVALEDPFVGGVRRSTRIAQLVFSITTMVEEEALTARLVARLDIKSVLLGKKEGTKHEVARQLAELFPHELACRIPPKRKPWSSEDYRMGIFDAVAVAYTVSKHRSKPQATMGTRG
jgi:Holliday junction resolvasome RuvABC endonuclease subunit